MPPAPTYSFNPFKGLSSEGAKWRFPVEEEEEVHAFHRTLPGYQSTPLGSLPGLSASLEVGNVLVKDESQRLGLNAFKVLGARYAVYRILQRRWQENFGSPLDFAQFLDTSQARRLGELTFCAATDGNHGKAVVWISRHQTMRCVVFVPAHATKDRIMNIEAEQAHVIVVEGDYAATLVAAGQAARENGWTEVGDCVYEGYTEIPSWIQTGYETLFREIEEQTGQFGRPDFLFLQSRVGGFAAAAANHYATQPEGNGGDKAPVLICVEPEEVAGCLASIMAPGGDLTSAAGNQDTIMAGLNCSDPSHTAWPILKDSIDLFLSVSDNQAVSAMKYFASDGIISGESGAAWLV
jgi:diaminopropionate ammonia-lyase